jgi:hypothetical protein
MVATAAAVRTDPNKASRLVSIVFSLVPNPLMLPDYSQPRTFLCANANQTPSAGVFRFFEYFISRRGDASGRLFNSKTKQAGLDLSPGPPGLPPSGLRQDGGGIYETVVV